MSKFFSLYVSSLLNNSIVYECELYILYKFYINILYIILYNNILYKYFILYILYFISSGENVYSMYFDTT